VSKPSERLQRIRDDLDTILTKRNEGTADYPREVPRIDTAFQRALDRAGGGALPSDGERGGSSSPDSEDAHDRRMADRVKRQAEKDAWAISTIIARMVKDADELRVITDRQAEVVHESKLPTDVLPGCRSCARKEERDGRTIGGQWAPVDEKFTTEGLCRQCGEFKLATGGIPPIMWCDIRHRQGGKAANKWLAKEYPKLLDSVQRKQKAKTRLTADDLELRSDEVIVAASTS
jgi:hypothetical protein